MRVSLFIPCFVDQFFPQIGTNIITLLEKLNHEVDYPERQTCCGQPAFNAGFCGESREAAEAFVDCFRDTQTVVVPSGSCAAMVKIHYRELFKDTDLFDTVCELGDRTWELSEFLVKVLGVTDLGARFPGRATFHDGCHGLRGLGIKESPRELLRHVRELELIEMDEAESCCGFGGTFSVKFPRISTAMAQVKCASIEETGARYVISNDPSCLLHLQGYIDRQGKPIKCLHLSEVLVRS